MNGQSSDTNVESSDKAWHEVASGELANAVEQRKREVSRRAWLRGGVQASGAVVLLASGGLIVHALNSPQTVQTQLTCAEVKQLLPQYIDDKIDRQLKRDVDSHLAKCEHCRKRLEDLREA